MNIILAYAEQKNAGYIVMGSHGRSGMYDVFIGSLTKELTKLPPKQIQRVEFSDVPSALYPDAAGVLNVVLKRPETGGDFHGETIQPLHGQAELGARRDCALLPSPSAADRRLLTVLELPKADRVRRI